MRYLMFAWCLVVAPMSAAYADNLTGDQLKQILVGHTLKWKSEKFNGTGTTIYNPDGTAVVTGTGEKPSNGTWVIKGNQFCVKMEKKKEDCGGPIDQVDTTVFYQPKYQAVIIVQ